MGMLKEGVRLDRVRGGRQKYRRNPDLLSQQWPPNKNIPSLEENKMLEALIICEPEMLTVRSETPQSDPTLQTINSLSDLYDRELVCIIGWAKQIPGFTDLSLNDQMRLLQSTWAEILTLTIAYRSLPHCAGKVRFAADLVLDERQARECGFSEIYQQCTQVIDRLEHVAVSKEEYYFLKALVLANSDVKLDEFSSLKKFRNSILSSLGDCIYVLR
ncbi:hypothetical protein WDU94_013212 [Cyamophila willieti]